MEFTPTSKAVSDILSSGRQYEIPRFQRAYSWDKKINGIFFHDIIKRVSVHEDKNEADRQPYFIGTMLFLNPNKEEPNVSSSEAIKVIDGQQRLTSITIFLSALARRFKELAEEFKSRKGGDKKENSQSEEKCNKAYENIFKYYITRENNDGEKFPIIKAKTSYPFFGEVVQTPYEQQNSDIPEKNLSDEEELILLSYKGFYKDLDPINLGKEFEIKGLKRNPELYLSILRAIRETILNSTVIVIETNSSSSANMIFQILNGKGLHLSSIDLIKNRIFEVVDDRSSATDFAMSRWNEVLNNLQEPEESVGFATFYRHFWESKYKRTSISHLFDEFERKIPANKSAYKIFLKTLVSESKVYREILDPNSSDLFKRQQYAPLVQSLRALDRFNIDQSRIALLALFEARRRCAANSKTSTVLSQKLLLDAARTMEYFHFAYSAVCHQPANKIERVYSTFACNLRKADTAVKARSVIVEDLYKQLAPLFPQRQIFVDSYMTLTFTKKDSARNIPTRYAVNLLNEYYENKGFFPPDSSVEHIVPESSAGKNPEVLSIGNLISCETEINNAAGQEDYETKRKLFYPRSSYKWLKSFIAENHTWPIRQIQPRSEELAQFTYDKILDPFFKAYKTCIPNS